MFRNYATSTILSLLVPLAACLATFPARGQERRDREPNSVYADRRAKLSAQVECPIILWGLTGREESSQTYIFEQEENFYYLTGHNEEGAALMILPAAKSSTNDASGSPHEFFYLPAKNPLKEKWNGARMSPTDPGIEARTGFAAIKPFPDMRAEVENLAKTYPSFYTILPYERNWAGTHMKRKLWIGSSKPRRRSSCKTFARKSTQCAKSNLLENWPSFSAPLISASTPTSKPCA